MHVLPLKQKIVSTKTEKEIIFVDILDKKKTENVRMKFVLAGKVN